MAADGKGFATGFDELDALAPAKRFARGAVHEVLSEAGQGRAIFFAMLLARAACGITPAPLPHGAIIWCDPAGEIYPPALAAFGIPLQRMFLLKTHSDRETVWAVAECLRCKGVGAVVAAPAPLSRIEARRLQLAAERGGGAGVLLRPARGRGSTCHAAATRWLVRPVPGERTLQRWSVQLIHGHGGRVGQNVILECSRENHRLSVRPAPADPVRQVAELAHRSPAAKAG